MSSHDREGLWGYYLFFIMVFFALGPLLLVALATWIGFTFRSRHLERRRLGLEPAIR